MDYTYLNSSTSRTYYEGKCTKNVNYKGLSSRNTYNKEGNIQNVDSDMEMVMVQMTSNFQCCFMCQH